MVDLSSRVQAIRQKLGLPGAGAAHDLLGEAQFTNADALAVTGISATQLHNWTSRGWLNLSSGGSPGKGKRRLYTAKDVIAIRLASEFAPMGMMQIAKQVLERTGWATYRADTIIEGLCTDLGMTLYIVMVEDDWLYVHSEDAIPEDCPVYLTVKVDSIILRTMEQLVAIIDGADPIPLIKPKNKTAQELFEEAQEYFGAFSYDEQGRRICTGLTYEESQEFIALMAKFDADEETYEERQRYYELNNQHADASAIARMRNIVK